MRGLKGEGGKEGHTCVHFLQSRLMGFGLFES